MVQVRPPQQGRPVPRLLRVERDQAQVEPEGRRLPRQEDSIWELDPKTNEWYLHHFYKHQPDLNIENPKVQEEISRTLGFWLELGVSGFRVDAVPFLFAKDEVPGKPDTFDPNQYLCDVRNFVNRRVGDAVLLGEVNVAYKDQKAFFGGPDGDGLNMQFDFIGMQNIFLSPWPAATPARSPRPCGSDRASTSPASGPTSCATTTNSPSTS